MPKKKKFVRIKSFEDWLQEERGIDAVRMVQIRNDRSTPFYENLWKDYFEFALATSTAKDSPPVA